jgi:hypothetical protein
MRLILSIKIDISLLQDSENFAKAIQFLDDSYHRKIGMELFKFKKLAHILKIPMFVMLTNTNKIKRFILLKKSF